MNFAVEPIAMRVEPEPEAIIITGGLEREGHENFAQFCDTFLERKADESVEFVSYPGARCCPCCGGRICDFWRP